MVHTRFSMPEATFDGDPVVEVHESEFDKLRARSNWAIPNGIIGLLALVLLLAGALRVELFVRNLNAATESRIAVMASQVEALKKQLADQTNPGRIADLAREANAEQASVASATAQRALSTAQRAEASVAPVAEQVASVDGRVAEVRNAVDAVSQAGTVQRGEIAKLSQSVDALRTDQAARLEGLSRQIQSQGTQVSSQSDEIASTKKWTRIVGASAAAALGIATVHALGHDQR